MSFPIVNAGERPPRMLVVWCPDWPVITLRIDAGTPGAVVADGRVAACSAAARAEGVRRGQKLRDAQRVCPSLVVAERDLEAEGRLFERVVSAVTAITPRVEALRPGVCAAPVRGPARYYGGEAPYRALVVEAVTAAGFPCGVGMADGLFAAGLAARASFPPPDRSAAPADPATAGGSVDGGSGGGVIVPAGETPGFLAGVSVRVLDRPEMVSLLGRLGVETLGELAALPVSRLAERFGHDGVVVHRLASGLDARPLAPKAPREDLSRTYEFDPPTDAGERVVFAAKALAEDLHDGLAARGLVCVRLAAELTWDDGRTLTRLWRHDGALSALAVAERVRWQMSGAQAPAHENDIDAPGGIRLLRLAPDALAPDAGEQQALWGHTPVSGRVGRAAARVQALLGHGGIVRPVLVGGRGPAERVVRVPIGDLAPEPKGDGPWPDGVPAPSPSIVYPAPHPVEVLGADGTPVTVDARCAVSAPLAEMRTPGGGTTRAVTAWTGPWPMTEFWWDPARARRRARFQARTADGHAYLLLLENGRWYVEAAYA